LTEFGLQVLLPKERQPRLGDPQPGLTIYEIGWDWICWMVRSVLRRTAKSCWLFR